MLDEADFSMSREISASIESEDQTSFAALLASLPIQQETDSTDTAALQRPLSVVSVTLKHSKQSFSFGLSLNG